MAAGNLLVPHITSLNVMAGVLFVVGLASGTIQSGTAFFHLFFVSSSFVVLLDAGSISRILILWGSESAPLLQMLDFCYALGCIIGPFASQPFIIEIPTNNSSLVKPEDLQLIYPYSGVGAAGTTVFVVSLLVSVIYWIDVPHPSRAEKVLEETKGSSSCTEKAEKDASAQSPSDSHSSLSDPIGTPVALITFTDDRCLLFKKICVISLASITYAVTNGIGMIEQNFLTKYAKIGPFALEEKTGAKMTGSSWLIHLICGILFVFLIKKLGIAMNLLFGSVLIFVTANFLLITSLMLPESLCLWAAVAGFSIGGTTFFSCLVAFLESKFPVSPRMTSLYLITNCVCNVIWPALVGQFIDQAPIVFVIVIYACSAISLLAVISMLVTVRIWFKSNSYSINTA